MAYVVSPRRQDDHALLITLAVGVGVLVLELGEVTSAEACYQFLHEEMGARLFVSVEGLELDLFSLRLCLAPGCMMWMTQTPFL
jgi:hypothetical protein